MRITAKLAYSELRKHRSRTRWSLLAIALSSALLMTVCSFVASGNAQLIELVGTDYGSYRQTYISLLFIPAVLMGIIIITMSIVVISNVFRISADERMAQFGILKCVGATGKQISTTILYESMFLSAVGIPAGILSGILLTCIGIKIANSSLGDLNSLVNFMITDFHLELHYVFSWQALLITVGICFLTVLFSAWMPGHKAAKASAVDSVRGAGTVKVSKTKNRTNPLIQKFFGFEGTLASKNIRRSRRNFRATVIALTAGVVLFICLGSLGTLAGKMTAYLQPDTDYTVISDYMSARPDETHPSTSSEDSIYLHPIDSNVGNVIAEKLREYDGKSVFGMGMDLHTYHTFLPAEFISEEMQNALDETARDTYELKVEMIPLDEYNYKALCDKAGVPIGSNILLNHYSYNDNGTEVDLAPYLSTLKKLDLIKADGSQSELSIDGVLEKKDMPKDLFYPNRNPIRLIVQQATVGGYSWYSAPENEAEFIKYATAVLEEAFPEAPDSDYMENAFSTRSYNIDDYMKVMNIAISIVLVFLYSFVVLLMFIGFTNVISTMSTNVLMRAREFAVLQSVGMTPEGIKQMLALESVLCSLKALLLGVPIGLLLTYLINLPIRSMYPIPYQFPWFAVLCCALGVFGITWGTTFCAANKLRRQNLIETIRTQSGR